MEIERWRLQFLSWVLAAVSRGLIFRDRLFRVTERLRKYDAREEFFIVSGKRKLGCAYVHGIDEGPAVLLCHGIGETIEHWSAVQALFRDYGIGSLAFNYSGYGNSSGQVRAEYCDEDLVEAYAELRRRVGLGAPVFVLGFSLGSGIAACGAGALHPAVAGLFLCEAFDSFREAACAAGVPHWLTCTIPNIWVTVDVMARIRMPVCIVHSNGDRLFPLEMPRKITKACGRWGDLIIVEGLAHSEPYLTASEEYWRPVIERVRSYST